jgi:hypothetical protein
MLFLWAVSFLGNDIPDQRCRAALCHRIRWGEFLWVTSGDQDESGRKLPPTPRTPTSFSFRTSLVSTMPSAGSRYESSFFCLVSCSHTRHIFVYGKRRSLSGTVHEVHKQYELIRIIIRVRKGLVSHETLEDVILGDLPSSI